MPSFIELLDPPPPAPPTIENIGIGVMFRYGERAKDDNVYMKVREAKAPHAVFIVNLRTGFIYSVYTDSAIESVNSIRITQCQA